MKIGFIYLHTYISFMYDELNVVIEIIINIGNKKIICDGLNVTFLPTYILCVFVVTEIPTY